MQHGCDGEDREGDRHIEVTESAQSDHAGKLEQEKSLPAAPADFADSRFHGCAHYVRPQLSAGAEGHNRGDDAPTAPRVDLPGRQCRERTNRLLVPVAPHPSITSRSQSGATAGRKLFLPLFSMTCRNCAPPQPALWHGARTVGRRADAQHFTPTQHPYTFSENCK